MTDLPNINKKPTETNAKVGAVKTIVSYINNKLYIILADYSNDLHNLKKRNGKAPADAAVDRLTQLLLEAEIKWLENLRIMLEDNTGPVRWRVYGLSEADRDNRLANLKLQSKQLGGQDE